MRSARSLLSPNGCCGAAVGRSRCPKSAPTLRQINDLVPGWWFNPPVDAVSGRHPEPRRDRIAIKYQGLATACHASLRPRPESQHRAGLGAGAGRVPRRHAGRGAARPARAAAGEGSGDPVDLQPHRGLFRGADAGRWCDWLEALPPRAGGVARAVPLHAAAGPGRARTRSASPAGSTRWCWASRRSSAR